MIELAFGESAAGSLKAAKSCGFYGDLSGPVAIIGGSDEEKTECLKKCESEFPDKPMAGSPADVEALTLALDIGDISDTDGGMDRRKSLLDTLFACYPGVADEIWKTNLRALCRLQGAKKEREPVRMWVSRNDPAEMCGLYFVCRFMADSAVPLSVVFIPPYLEKDGCITSFRSTGELSPREFSGFSSCEERISECGRAAYANMWSELVSENAPLRAVVNGGVKSVPEDFYDFAIRANLPDTELRVAQLIGKTLNYISGVGDIWLFLRIKSMITSGEILEIVPASGDHPYSGVIRKGLCSAS